MSKKLLFIFIAGLIVGSGGVMAAEDNPDDPHSGDGHKKAIQEKHEMPEGMLMPDSDSHSQHNSEKPDKGHGNGQEVAEVPANLKVLGAFGLVNLGFILFGVWNKWLREQEEKPCRT